MSLMLVGSASCANTAQADEPGNGPHKKTHTIAWSQEAFDEAGIKPGDIVVIRSGTYRDLPVKIDIDATAERPVLIRAEKPGSVVLTGMSSLSIGGSDITVSGLYFKDCDVAAGDAVFNFRTSAKKHAVRSRLDDCIFSGSGLAENKDKDIKWVSVYGHDNEVTRCSFIDKKILGSLLVVWIDPQVIPNHRIRGNYFTHPFSLQKHGSAINGQEMIRIGTSAVSMSEGRCEICDNYFFRCNGEVEIISNKSCANTYRNNVFDSCEGTLTLRHGNDCTGDGNYFFGRGAPNTGGVRIIGERHRVFNNYFEGLAGNSQRSAISLVRGVENSELFEYFQVKDAQVAFNTIVNCKSGITANIGNSASTMPVTDSRVTGNLIVNNAAGTPPEGVTVITAYGPGIVWEANHFHGVTVSGLTGGGVDATGRFDLILDGGLYLLPADKAALYGKIRGFAYVATDIRGIARPQAKTPGANEPVGECTRTMPSPATTGATWQPTL